MKIKFALKLFLIILLLLFITWIFTSGKVYTASAASSVEIVDDIPEQNYDGISINSHIKKDFEYLGLDEPETYATGTEKKIITLAEAIYKRDGELKKEVVVYVYHPAYRYTALPGQKLEISFRILSQHRLASGEYVEFLPYLEYRKTQEDNLYEVAHYEGIKKYTYSKKLNDTLLSQTDVSNMTVGKNTVIQVDLEKTGYNDYFDGLKDVKPKKLFKQEFQFISECGPSQSRSIDQTNTSLCVSHDVNTVSVDGKTLKLRYKTSDVYDFKFIKQAHETEFTDIFYFLFNVTDDTTGEQWSSEKQITEVNLKYFEYSIKYYEYKEFNTSSTIKYEKNNRIEYKKTDGSVYKTVEIPDPEMNKPYELPLLDKSELTAIYKTQKVTPEKITLNYLEDSDYNKWVAFAGGHYNSLVTTYLTLFNTKSDEAKEYLNASSEFNQSLINGYNFGLVYGNYNGYAGIYENTSEAGLFKVTTKYINETSYAELVGLIDITYKENGETYYVTVSSTKVDNSGLDNPIPGDDDFWQDEPGEPIPHPKNPDSWWEKIVKFFKDIFEKIKGFFSKIKTFFSSTKSVIIFITIVLIIVVALVTMFRFINFVNTAHVAKEMRKYNKKE